MAVQAAKIKSLKKSSIGGNSGIGTVTILSKIQSLSPSQSQSQSPSRPASRSSSVAAAASSRRKSAHDIVMKDNSSSSSEDSAGGSDDYQSDEKPAKKKAKVSKTMAKPIKKPARPVKKEKIEQEDKPKPKAKNAVVKVKKEGGEGAQDEGEEEEVYKWWLEGEKEGGVKWDTLQHSGPLFPPEYIPHGVKMNYDGQPVTLTPAAEEVASFFAALIETDYAKNKTFCKNFFVDFLQVIKDEKKPCPIKQFEKCDFRPIFSHLEKQKELKKAMSKEEKKALKEEKAKVDDVYGLCLLDGRKEKVGNFRIEPPGLFRGRGEHPKTGCLKLRVRPEQVTINIGADAIIPTPPPGHTWGSVTHDNAVTWLAMWKENVNENTKYIFLAANSSLKGQSDFKKFEKARELKKHIGSIRSSYTADLKNDLTATRQLATCLYFIDKLALRAGNEKGDDEADTVGCCSLRFEHLTLEPPNKVVFDFLGKDSIRYVNSVQVDAQVFKNLKIFKKAPKVEGDDLFDRINTSILNKHLNQFMPGLTAKVFRTYNASFTFQEELKKTPEEASVAEKVLAYNRANREVAILCNHQRAVPKGHGVQMEKLNDKILALKYERKLVKEQMLEMEPKFRKNRPDVSEKESDIDDAFLARHSAALDAKEEDRNAKALVKLNEKRKEEGEAVVDVLPGVGKLKPGDLFEREKEKIQEMSLEKLEKRLGSLTEKIASQKTLLVDKDENKQTALGTSKINYIDPRITAAWCAKYGVPLEKMFTKTLREKFTWAMDTKSDFVF